jgi:hypothetical protein
MLESAGKRAYLIQEDKSTSIAPVQHQARSHGNGPRCQPVCKGCKTSSKALDVNGKNLNK